MMVMVMEDEGGMDKKERLKATSGARCQAPGKGVGWKMKAMQAPKRSRENRAVVATADLGGGGHADLRDKRVIKQAEDLLLLDLLGWGVFGGRRDRWAFPELWVSRRKAAQEAQHSVGVRETKTK